MLSGTSADTLQQSEICVQAPASIRQPSRRGLSLDQVSEKMLRILHLLAVESGIIALIPLKWILSCILFIDNRPTPRYSLLHRVTILIHKSLISPLDSPVRSTALTDLLPPTLPTVQSITLLAHSIHTILSRPLDLSKISKTTYL